VIKERKDGVLQDLLQPHSPRLRPEMPEHFNNAKRIRRPVIRRYPAEHVNTDRALALGIGIKNDDVLSTSFRNVVEKMLVAIAVRIHKADAGAGFNVLLGDVFKKGGFAGARLADDVHRAAVSAQKGKRGLSPRVPEVANLYIGELLHNPRSASGEE
jgi:hypothetical protein